MRANFANWLAEILSSFYVDEMGGTRSTHGIDEKCIQYFGWKVKDHSGDLGIDGKIILEWIFREVGW
jgi:hypothetical protein